MASQSAEYSQLQLLQYIFEEITDLQMLHIKYSVVNSRNASSVLYCTRQCLTNPEKSLDCCLHTWKKPNNQNPKKQNQEKQSPGIGAREKRPTYF